MYDNIDIDYLLTYLFNRVLCVVSVCFYVRRCLHEGRVTLALGLTLLLLVSQGERKPKDLVLVLETSYLHVNRALWMLVYVENDCDKLVKHY
jgi:hypothetical protein